MCKTTQVRGAIAHHYSANVRPRVSDEAWASAAPIVKQAAVGAALQTVDDYARASAAAGGFDRAEAHLSRTNLRLDAKGWEAAAKAFEKLLGELNRIEEARAEAPREGPARRRRERRRARPAPVRGGPALAAQPEAPAAARRRRGAADRDAEAPRRALQPAGPGAQAFPSEYLKGAWLRNA